MSNWDFIKELKFDSLIAITSLIVAYLALYRTSLKKGKFQIILYSQKQDVRFQPASRHRNGVNDCFMLGIPIMIRNIGAGPVGIKDISWKIEVPDTLKINITPSSSFESFLVMEPYEQKLFSLRIELEAKGYGFGFSKEYFDRLDQIKAESGQYKILLKCSYRVCGKKKMERVETTFDISSLFNHYLTFNYLDT